MEWFLAATKQLYDSVCHIFFTMFPSWSFQELLPWSEVMSMQKVKVKGQGHRGQYPT